MVAVCPATEPARLLAPSPARGHACSPDTNEFRPADGGRSFVSFRRLARVLRLPPRLAAFQPGSVSASSLTVSSVRFFFGRRTPRACHGACDHLRPRQAPRQSRGLLGLLDARTRNLRSKRRSGHRKRLDNRKTFSGEFGHAKRLLRHSDSFLRILRHESALLSASFASELQQERNG